ncbi:MAG: hypothetical protein M0R77_02500 [Gammaproteobacteria bacterium]|nr:hypothetical protein [Gammaproteobacteria bacterium]
MNGPTPEDMAEMRRIQSLLNNLDEEDFYSNTPSTPINENYNVSAPVAPPPAMAGDDADQIRRHIMAINNLMPDMIEESRSNVELREAIITEKVSDNAIQVGTWKIEKTLVESVNGKKEPNYHISNVVTKQKLEPVFVYEAAQAILKILNQGHNLHDKEIDAIMELDEEYQRLRDKALQEKAVWQRAKNNNIEWKQQLYESKFNSSQYQALYIKERIKNYLLK